VAAPVPAAAPPSGQFAFGSYGRVIAATDFRGRPGRDADIVAHGSRLDESNYVELELRREDTWEKTGTTSRVVATVALAHPIFHYNGVFDASIALRNLYLEGRDLGIKGLSAWAGSRMYRGDNIYPLDWWPLDNLNTLGGGARFVYKERTSAAIHAGFSKPETGFYTQTVDRPLPLNQIGAARVEILARQRFTGSLRVEHRIPVGERAGLKGVAYGELHQVPSGQRQSAPGLFDRVPADSGYVIGAQIGGWTGERDTHVNLFVRYSRGLAAYGELATPSQLSYVPTDEGGLETSTSGAHEFLVALGGNWENGPVGVMVGAYVRSFRNASADLDVGDVDEGIVLARPHFFLGELGGVALEASYQAQQRGVVAALQDQHQQAPPSTAAPEGPLSASLVRFGLIPFLSLAGRGNFTRPHLRLIYALTLRDQGARALYPQDDVFGLRKVEHFFGLGAEWWFNTSS